MMYRILTSLGLLGLLLWFGLASDDDIDDFISDNCGDDECQSS